MIPVTIFVPAPSEKKRADFEAVVTRLMGGITSNGVCSGTWNDSGNLVKDTHWKYIVACNLVQDGPLLLEIISYIKEKFHQQAVYLEYAGHVEIL